MGKITTVLLKTIVPLLAFVGLIAAKRQKKLDEYVQRKYPREWEEIMGDKKKKDEVLKRLERRDAYVRAERRRIRDFVLISALFPAAVALAPAWEKYGHYVQMWHVVVLVIVVFIVYMRFKPD